MSAPAVTGPLLGPGLTDVRMMAVAHTSFRRELKLAVPAIRGVVEGDRRRVRVVAEHISLWLGLVHHHHAIEDELLWDRLVERLPAEQAPLIALMEQQHAGVAEVLDGAGELIDAWARSAAAADQTALADRIEVIVDRLCEHLAAEESRVLPLMARYITAAEWEEFTERGMESVPKGMMLTGFGMMLYEGDPAAIAVEIGKLPAPLRPVLPVLARWAFRRYAHRLHGTATPEPGLPG